MTVTACYLIYNDAPMLPRSLTPLFPHVDKIIFVEGAFATMPGPLRSDDGTIALLGDLRGQFLDKISIIYSETKLGEIEARNLYLDLLTPEDLFLLVDADEIAEGDVEAGLARATQGQKRGFGIRMVEPTRAYYRRKLFRYEAGMRFYRGQPSLQQIETPPPYPVIDEFWFRHVWKERSLARDELREASYRAGGGVPDLALGV